MASRDSSSETGDHFCYFHDDHNGDGRVSIWCPVPPDVQEERVSAELERLCRPAPSASGTFSGWLGTYVDCAGNNRVDLCEIGEMPEWGFSVRYLAHGASAGWK